jgi:hypothetical protein
MRKSVATYHSQSTAVTLMRTASSTPGDVLPGFRCVVRRIFD